MARDIQYAYLPHVAEKKPTGVLVGRSMTQMMRAFRKERAVSCAGDDGALVIWKDDAGLYRGERHRYMAKQDEICCSTKQEIAEWVTKQIPKLQDFRPG